ncbi:hypothetical protein ACFQ3S_01015 [Mucilaginibacter terrae]
MEIIDLAGGGIIGVFTGKWKRLDEMEPCERCKTNYQSIIVNTMG